jgi:hypothetical protein
MSVQTNALVVALLAAASPMMANSQTGPAPENDPQRVSQEVFTAENAILDTSILFAIGAREAQQELRSAFGWPTYQEGLVDGVYFRLDPDGYARFSPTPRLESDVFEVICQPGNVSACMGRKDRLSVYLGTSGLIEIKITDVAPGDTYFISDGLQDTPVPDRILMPLDPPLEMLLAYGSELIVRRGADEVARISLKGLGPVMAYLRWVAAHQNYAVLPRDWPIPGTATLTEGTVDPDPRPGLAAFATEVAAAPLDAGAAAPPPLPSSVATLEAQLQDVLLRLQRLEGLLGQPATPSIPHLASAATLPTPDPAPSSPTMANVDLFNYLVTALGLDPEVATLIVTMQDRSKSGAVIDPVAAAAAMASAPPAARTPEFVPLSNYLRAIAPSLR